MTWSDLAGVALLAVGGFLVGGAYTAWRGSRAVAMVLSAAAVLSVAAGITWLL